MLRFGPSDQIKMSSATVWNGYLTVRLSEVRQQIVLDSRSSYVAKVGPRPTDEKRSSHSRAKSSWTSVSDEAAVICQVA